MTFGELRAARPGLFASSGTENDVRQIALPLNEIITRISPTLLSRRAGKKVEAADDISDPFGARAQGINFAASKPPTHVATETPRKAPEPASATRKSVSLPTIPAPRPASLARSPEQIASAPIAFKTAPAIKMVEPVVATTPPAPAATIPFSPTPAAVTAKDSTSAPQTPDEHPILAPLSALAEKWPDALKMELAEAKLIGAQAALPRSLIEPGLKRGRVAIQWKDLRMMFRPKSGPDSAHDLIEVELPLNVLAPLFFASQKSGDRAKQILSAAEEIPDLFHSSKQNDVAAAFMPSPKPAPVPSVAAAPPRPVAAVAAPPVEPVISMPQVAAAAPAAPGQGTMLVPLGALMEKWPEPLRLELAQRNLLNAQVALPLNLLEPAMKRGRVAFSWRDLRSWIQSAPAAATQSAHDGAELELPLKVVAPLFLGRQTAPVQSQSRVAVDQSIPSPFSSVATPESTTPIITPFVAPATAPAPDPVRRDPKPMDAKLSETNFYVWGDTTDTPSVNESEYKRAQAPATDFTSRKATPKEIVARAMKLPGVAGVVVALCDGLRIAGEVPPELNADTAAAFLPQIFDRVAQCTRELRMGMLNNLKFTVGNVPWHIFHVNAIYFAAFGRAGESLPTAQLASLAGELDRKKQ